MYVTISRAYAVEGHKKYCFGNSFFLLSNTRCGGQLGETQSFNFIGNFCVSRYISFQIRCLLPPSPPVFPMWQESGKKKNLESTCWNLLLKLYIFVNTQFGKLICQLSQSDYIPTCICGEKSFYSHWTSDSLPVLSSPKEMAEWVCQA